MGNTIRKLLYSILFVTCLLLGVVGLLTSLSGKTFDKDKDKENNEYIVCKIKQTINVDGPTEIVDYYQTEEVRLTINNKQVKSKIVDVLLEYEIADNYTARKDRLIKAGANYKFDDEKHTIEYQRSLESNALDGVNITKSDINAHFTTLGYTCE